MSAQSFWFAACSLVLLCVVAADASGMGRRRGCGANRWRYTVVAVDAQADGALAASWWRGDPYGAVNASGGTPQACLVHFSFSSANEGPPMLGFRVDRVGVVVEPAGVFGSTLTERRRAECAAAAFVAANGQDRQARLAREFLLGARSVPTVEWGVRLGWTLGLGLTGWLAACLVSAWVQSRRQGEAYYRLTCGCCPACGYGRVGLAEGALCPECGKEAKVEPTTKMVYEAMKG